MNTTTIKGITAEQQNALHDAAHTWAAAESGTAHVSETVAGILGTSPTWTFYGLVRTEFVTAYMADRKCDQATADQAWSRLTKRMTADYGLEQPKSDKGDAKKKAEKKATLEKLAGNKSPVLLMREAEEALEQGKTARANQLIDASKIATKRDEKTAKESQSARWKALDEKIKAAKKSADVKTLEALEKLLGVTVPAKAGKRSKAN
jgi:hypothetical protein